MFNNNQIRIIEATEEFVNDFMKSYDDSHNFAHVIRVKNMATIIAQSENLSIDDIFEIQLSALTHDVNDHKYTTDLYAQETILEEFFKDKLDKNIMQNVIKLACNVSLSKETALEYEGVKIICKKLHCVQDADRIDSLGAVGITRYFAFGMHVNKSKISEIINNIDKRTSILIKHIKTRLGQKIANEKYAIMKAFLEDYNQSI
jgi:uncharacterized protein